MGNEVWKQSNHSELCFMLFHFGALSGCKGTNVEALLSEHNANIHHSFEENLIQHMSVEMY